jgi:hypothetical protein
VAEVSRGFGQTQQQLGRLEKRVDAIDGALGDIQGSNNRTEMLLGELLASIHQ